MRIQIYSKKKLNIDDFENYLNFLDEYEKNNDGLLVYTSFDYIDRDEFEEDYSEEMDFETYENLKDKEMFEDIELIAKSKKVHKIDWLDGSQFGRTAYTKVNGKLKKYGDYAKDNK